MTYRGVNAVLRLRRPEEASRRRERFPDGGSSKELLRRKRLRRAVDEGLQDIRHPVRTRYGSVRCAWRDVQNGSLRHLNPPATGHGAKGLARPRASAFVNLEHPVDDHRSLTADDVVHVRDTLVQLETQGLARGSRGAVRSTVIAA